MNEIKKILEDLGSIFKFDELTDRKQYFNVLKWLNSDLKSIMEKEYFLELLELTLHIDLSNKSPLLIKLLSSVKRLKRIFEEKQELSIVLQKENDTSESILMMGMNHFSRKRRGVENINVFDGLPIKLSLYDLLQKVFEMTSDLYDIILNGYASSGIESHYIRLTDFFKIIKNRMDYIIDYFNYDNIRVQPQQRIEVFENYKKTGKILDNVGYLKDS